MKQKGILVLLLIPVLLVGAALLYQKNRQAVVPVSPGINFNPSPTSAGIGQKITVQGEIVCLPSKNTQGIQTQACAIGLRADDGTYWGLDNIQNDLVSGKFTNGDRVEVSGTTIPDTAGKFQIKGIIQTSSVTVIKKGSQNIQE